VKKVLIDSSSAILIYKSGIFERLAKLYNFYVPDSVFKELTCNSHSGSEEFKFYSSSGIISVKKTIDEPQIDPLLTPGLDRLGRGERDALRMFFNGGYSFIIIDDGKGAFICRNNSIPYINALLVPAIFKSYGLIEDAEYMSLFNRISSLGWYSDRVKDFAKKITSADLKFFIP